MEKRIFIGIDPGINGGIVVLDVSGEVVSVSNMPKTPKDIFEYIKKYSDGSICVLEDVGYGIPRQSTKSIATFARHNGHLEMALVAAGVPTEKVTPKKWQKTFQLGDSTGLKPSVWKNKLKAKAQMLFPSLGSKVTLTICDALLLAEYGRRTFK